MTRDESKLVQIPGELHAITSIGITAATEEVFDYDSSSFQSQLNKQVYNVSIHDSSYGTRHTLEEAIAAVPESYHVGGLILTFISKEGDFEMYQLKSQDWTDNTSKWEIITTAIVQKDNQEYIEVHIDDADHLLYGVQKDGNFYFGCGVPSQIKDYVDEIKAEIDSSINVHIDEIDEKIAALDASTKADIARLDASVSTGFDRVDASIAALDSSIYALGYYEENPEYVEAHLDSSSKLLYGVQKDGNFYFGAGVPFQIRDYVNEKGEKIDASILEIETRFYNVNAHDGSIGINYTLEEAIAAVPEEYRNGGLILTFNSDGSNVIYQCKLDEFSIKPSDWKEFTDKKYVDNSLYDLKSNVDSSILLLNYKTSDISTFHTIDEAEKIIIETDEGVQVTSISAEKINDDTEGIVLTTDDDIKVSSIEISRDNKDDSEILEFNNDSDTETYAKIGVIDDKSGLFVNNIYNLNGKPLLQFDLSNDILTLGGKKYKMIPYVE